MWKVLGTIFNTSRSSFVAGRSDIGRYHSRASAFQLFGSRHSGAMNLKMAGLLPAGPIDASVWKAWTTAIAAKTGIKGKELFMPIRLALTGCDSGPELAPLLQIMGRDRILARLKGVSA